MQGLREVAAEFERLRELRTARVLAAIEDKVPRKLIAESAGISEPLVYKIRRDAQDEKAGESG